MKTLLIILDGFGIAPKSEGNAVLIAKMPFFENLKKKYPNTELFASGHEVGLPDGIMGASEPGHVTIGAGRIVFQPLVEINNSIKSGEFFEIEKLIKLFDYCKKNNKPLHLLGMISDAGVHSNLSHLFAILEFAKKYNLSKVYIHCILDGRDVEEKSAVKYISQIENKILTLGVGKIASFCGRYFAMDRDKNWDRIKVARDLYFEGKAENFEKIEDFYKTAKTDYYVNPVITKDFEKVKNGDGFLFWNFRADRGIQLSDVLINDDVKIKFLCFGPYADKKYVIFFPQKVKNNLGEVLSKNKKSQLRIAETEKYAHITFYFNSQKKEIQIGEKRILINSPKCKSYKEKPKMSAEKVKNKLCENLKNKNYDFVAVNFANPDLVGHSGDIDATVQALEFLDTCLETVVKTAKSKNYEIIIIADHGNAEQMLYPNTKKICPSHSTNKVPFILISKKYKNIELKKNRGLKDVAPSILKLMEIKKPSEMNGESLF